MFYQEIFLLLSEVFNLVGIHIMVGGISEDTHELGVVVVYVVPLWNLQDIIGITIRVLIRRANGYGGHLNI